MKNFTRREFLSSSAASAIAVSGGAAAPGILSQGGKDRPNILFIISDEHNAGVLGCNGNPLIRTPHLDEFAERGIIFDNAYTNSPLCVPARLAITSCKYISRVSAWNNSSWLPSDEYPSIAGIMRAAGYEAFLCGKMHHDRSRRNDKESVRTSRRNRAALSV